MPLKLTNDVYEIESVDISKEFSYYEHLKYIIKNGALIFNKELGEDFNGIYCFWSCLSDKNVFVNENLIEFKTEDIYEIQRQKRVGIMGRNNRPENSRVIDITYETDMINNVIASRFIEWWEGGVKDIIMSKYDGINKANSICQFARQIRNTFGHSKIYITKRNCPDPIWKGLNLLEHNGGSITDLLTTADFINFWIEFEEELNLINETL